MFTDIAIGCDAKYAHCMETYAAASPDTPPRLLQPTFSRHLLNHVGRLLCSNGAHRNTPHQEQSKKTINPSTQSTSHIVTSQRRFCSILSFQNASSSDSIFLISSYFLYLCLWLCLCSLCFGSFFSSSSLSVLLIPLIPSPFHFASAFLLQRGARCTVRLRS